jgi:hypothetical protein
MSSALKIGPLNVSNVHDMTFKFINVEEEPLLESFHASVLASLALVLLIAGVMFHVRIRTLLTRFCCV